jgi:hypothetical protein
MYNIYNSYNRYKIFLLTVSYLVALLMNTLRKSRWNRLINYRHHYADYGNSMDLSKNSNDLATIIH